jgi:hypothetical protein
MTVLNTQGIALPNAANVAIADISITVDGTYTVQLRGISSAEPIAYQLKLALKDTATPTTATPLVLPTGGTSTIAPVQTPSPLPTPTQPAPPKIEIKIRNK